MHFYELIQQVLIQSFSIISVAALHTSKDFGSVTARQSVISYSKVEIEEMASASETSKLEANSTEYPAQHDEKVEESSSTDGKKLDVKDASNSEVFDKQVKRIREVFEELRNAVIASTATLEKNFSQLKLKEERFNEISRKISSVNFESALKLNVGGNVYQTSVETLTKHPESLVTEMFSTSFDLKQLSDGCYFIDRDGTHFRHILNYLRSGTAPVPSILKADSEEILREAEYYGLVGLVKAINNKLIGDTESGSENVRKEGVNTESGVVGDTEKELFVTEEKLKSFLNLLDAKLKVLDEATRHHKEVTMKLSDVHFGENVKIDVGGRIFKVSLKTLRRESESVLGLMFSERFDLKKEEDGSFFIDRDGTFFHHILNYLRDGKVSEDAIEECGPQMRKEAEFYGLSGLKEQIDKYTIIKLKVGGRLFLVNREVLKKYRESMLGRVLAKEDCAFKKTLDGSYIIERDGTSFHYILEYLKFEFISDEVVEKGGKLLRDDAEFYILPGLKERINNYHNVKMNIGGREFAVSRRVLTRFPSSMFGLMLAGIGDDFVKGNDGSYFIQHDGSTFNHVLHYLRSETLSDNVIEKYSEALLDDAAFYRLPGLKERINMYYNVKIYVGKTEFVVRRKLLSKVPGSMFERMLTGEDGSPHGYVKDDNGSYYIYRDSETFTYILQYLNGIMPHPDRHLCKQLREDASFYGLPDFLSMIMESQYDRRHAHNHAWKFSEGCAMKACQNGCRSQGKC